jgi:ATP-dependent Clp protease ATP-binding subunit ClpA
MFEKISEPVRVALTQAQEECRRLSGDYLNCQHLMLALATSHDQVVSTALHSMSITHEVLRTEIERQLNLSSGGTIRPKPPAVPGESPCEVDYSEAVNTVMERAHHFQLFLGQKQLQPEHLLLALIESGGDGLKPVLEEIGANVTFLQRQIMVAVAARDCFSAETTGIGKTLTTGLGHLVSEHARSAEELKRLAIKIGKTADRIPDRSEIALLIFVSYLPEFLMVQVAFQRYLLEETLRMLTSRTGTLDQEINATMVSTSAQNLRAEVRGAIEQVWSHELRLFNQLPAEGEHDLIGMVIEDLWWTHSEEIALHEVFDEALDDHRRKQILNLQKRRLEISERLTKLRARLEETVKESLLKAISVK